MSLSRARSFWFDGRRSTVENVAQLHRNVSSSASMSETYALNTGEA